MQVRPHHLALLVVITIVLHAVQVAYYTSASEQHIAGALQQPPGSRASSAALASVRSGTAVGGTSQLLIATATQPAPCTTAHGDHVIQLSLKNKLQYATLHGYAVWPSTELLSPWDLGGQWNKVALLSVLMEPKRSGGGGGGGAYEGEWILWMDDDAIIVDMRFTFPLEQYDAAGIDLVMWGDGQMTYVDANSEGINTGIMLVRVSDWSRELLAEWTRLASSNVRESLTNHDQGGLVHLLYHQPERWRSKTLLERNFTMNGHWPEYSGLFVRGRRVLPPPTANEPLIATDCH